jgi:hypothetical protein
MKMERKKKKSSKLPKRTAEPHEPMISNEPNETDQTNHNEPKNETTSYKAA